MELNLWTDVCVLIKETLSAKIFNENGKGNEYRVIDVINKDKITYKFSNAERHKHQNHRTTGNRLYKLLIYRSFPLSVCCWGVLCFCLAKHRSILSRKRGRGKNKIRTHCIEQLHLTFFGQSYFVQYKAHNYKRGLQQCYMPFPWAPPQSSVKVN